MSDYQGLSTEKSFILSFLIYLALVFFVFFKLGLFNDPALKYTDLKDSFIDVQLGENIAVSNLKNTAISKIKNESENLKKEQKTTPHEVKTQEKEVVNDFNALFSKVKEIPEEATNKVQSSAKSTSKNSTLNTAASDLMKQLDQNLIQEEAQIIGQTQKAQMTGIYDEFLGALRRILEERWRLYAVDGNFEARVEFFIDSNGNFGYTSVSKVYDEKFDAKVLEFLENLKGKYIALPPENKVYKGALNLSDKIKIRE